jgi:DNA-binding CsgD family transcriptional regulator/PAS domain-containing protein
MSEDVTSEDDELRRVVGRLYDAALNPALWADALTGIAEFVGGQAGTLNPKSLVSKFVDAGDRVGLDLQYIQMHSETCVEFDSLTAVPRFDVRPIVRLPELMPPDEGCSGRIQKGSVRPAGRGDVASSVVEKSEKSCKLLGVGRNDPDAKVDDEMRRRMMLVAPHVRRAVLIGKALDRKADEAAAFADILDSLSAGLFLIDADGRIVHANAAGRGILAAGDFLRSIDGRMAARDTKTNRTLQNLFADKSDLDIGSKGIALPLTARDGEYHVAHVLPVGGRARPRAGVPRTVVAAVFVCKATLESPSSAEVIRRTYQLTRTELRVLLAIVNVGSIREVATALGVADCTIKTHVGRLFEKTGAGRQADLVKLVAGFFTPLVA